MLGQRWTREVKERIYNSRVESTRKLGDAMNRSEVKPGLFISASAVGIYGDRGEEKITEATPPADEFLAGVCKAWESEANRAATSGIGGAIPRPGIGLEKAGGRP